MSTLLPTIRYAQVGEYDAFWELIVYPDASWEVLGGTYVSRRSRGTLNESTRERLRESLSALGVAYELESSPFMHHLSIGALRWSWRNGQSPPQSVAAVVKILPSLYAGSEKSR